MNNIKLSLNAFSDIDLHQLLNLLKNYKVDNLELSTAFSLKYLNGYNRFANVEFINNFNKTLKENNIKTSIHLFGELANIIGNQKVSNEIINLINWNLLNRIQLNRYSVNIDIALENLSKLNFSGRLILPANKKDFDIIEFPLDDSVDWLYDCSHGKNKEINFYPIDKLENRIGNISYAGGINFNNIIEISQNISNLYPYQKSFYLDIESGIRENDKICFEKIKLLLDKFNLEKE